MPILTQGAGSGPFDLERNRGRRSVNRIKEGVFLSAQGSDLGDAEGVQLKKKHGGGKVMRLRGGKPREAQCRESRALEEGGIERGRIFSKNKVSAAK